MKKYFIGVFCSLVSFCFSQTSNQINWQQTNGPYGGDVAAFALSGSNLFAGTNGNGVFLSTNNGTSWSAMNSGLTSPWIYSLLASGTNLFAGTDGGVFLSTNNGASWNYFNTGLTNTSVQSLAMSGTNLYAGTTSGVFLSTNNGLIWNAINTGLTNASVTSFAVIGTNLFAGTLGGIFLSTNNGDSWASVTTGLPTTQVYCLAVSGTNLFAGTWDGVFLSTDNGANWHAMNSGLTNTIVKSFIVSGTNLYAGTMGGVYLSTNNGSSWSAINSGFTNTFIRALAVSGTNIFAGTGGRGVFLSTNNGGTWNTVNTGMTNCNVKALAANPANGGPGSINLFAGTAGGDIFLSTDNGLNWRTVNTGLAYNQINALTVSGSNILAGTTHGIFLSTNNGSSWIAINAGISNSDVRSFAVQGPNLFAGTWSDGVFLSTNNGLNWSPVNTGLPSTAIIFNLATCGANLFVYTFNSGVFLTTNSGSTWSAVNTGLTNTSIQSLASIGTNLFAGTWGSGVYRSTDNGSSWSPVNTGLSSMYVPLLTSVSTYLFAATSSGAFLSTNNGSSWSAINTGLTNTSVQVFANSSTNLFAGTSSGVFTCLFNTPPASPQHLTAAAGNTQSTLQWNKNTETDFLRYRIYRGTSPNPATKIDSTTGGITDTIKVCTGLANDTTYYFRITAVDNLGLESGYSDVVHATPYQPTLVMNPSFENGNNGTPDNWKAINYGDATLNWTNTISHTGLNSISIGMSSNAPNILSTWVSDYISVTPSTAYEFSYWIYVTKAPQTGQYFRFSTDFYDSLGNYITSNSSDANYTLNQWQNNYRRTMVYQNAAKIRFTISFNSNGQSYDSVGYFDDFRLSQINPIVSLQVIKPRGGDTLIAKSNYSIQWTSQTISKVDIIVSYKGGGNWNTDYLTIAKEIPALQGSYSWTIPDTLSNNTAIWLRDSYYSDYSATTNDTRGCTIVKAVYAMTVSNKNLNVGSVKIGQPKDTVVMITNKGNVSLIISNIISTNNSFVAGPSSFTIPPGGSAKETIEFLPSRLGADSTKIIITSNAPSSPDTIVVKAMSPPPLLSASVSALTLPSLAKGNYGIVTSYLKNRSINSMTIAKVTTKTTIFEAFVDSTRVAGLDSTALTVIFWPNSFGTFTDTVTIVSDGGTVKIPLAGSSPYPVMVTNQPSLSFGDVAKNSTKKDTIKISNSSINKLTIDSIFTKTAAFAVDQMTGTVMTDTLKLVVSFTPTLTMSYMDTVYLRNNSMASLVKLPVSGNAPTPIIAFRTSSVSFGTVRKDTPALKNINITNSSLSVLSVDSLYTMTKYFTIGAVKLPATITMGDTFLVAISFKPDTVKMYLDTLYVKNNSNTSLAKVSLIGLGSLTSVQTMLGGIPHQYELSQNYPNPYNPSTTIQYGLPTRSSVRLVIYNVLGQVVKELVNSEQQAGYQSVVWIATVSSGLYFYRLDAVSTENSSKRYVETKKMLLLK